MIQQPHVRPRTAGKFPTTAVTNELADAINSIAGLTVGNVPQAALNLFTLVRFDSAMDGGGWYKGVALLGPMRADGSKKLSMPENLKDGPVCLIANSAEDGKNLHRVPVDGTAFAPGFLVGVSSDDKQLPIYLVNYNYAVRNVRITAAGVWQQTFEDKEDPDTATYQTITDSVDCTTG